MAQVAANNVASEAQACATFDLLGLFDSIVLPSAVLQHLDINTRKLLRVCCKRLRAEVDTHVTRITINRYNIAKLQPALPGSLARRYPRLRRLTFGANEPRDVAALLRAQLPALAASATSPIECLDFWAYYASISSDLWGALVEHAPASLTLRLNINESLLRRMEVGAVLAALAALRAGRPGLVVEFATGHTSFGFRSTERETMRFLATADYVHSLGFSIGLRGRELQDASFFEHLAGAAPPLPPPLPAAAAAPPPAPPAPRRPPQPSAAAAALEALSLTHYEAEERPPVGPLLAGLHLLTALRSLTLDCEISLQEMAPLADCVALTRLTIDLLVARVAQHGPRQPPGGAGRRRRRRRCRRALAAASGGGGGAAAAGAVADAWERIAPRAAAGRGLPPPDGAGFGALHAQRGHLQRVPLWPDAGWRLGRGLPEATDAGLRCGRGGACSAGGGGGPDGAGVHARG